MTRRPGRDQGPVRQLALWQEALVVLALALVLAIVVKTLFLQAFYVPSASMEPQFVENDRILVQKVSYWGGASPGRGDTVVFSDPGGWLDDDEAAPASPLTRLLQGVGLYPSGGHLVKRVIGVAGDRVVCCDDQSRVTVNGHPLEEESYLPRGTPPSMDPFAVTVPRNHLWVMGDNRGDSADSRAHRLEPGGGFVAATDVVGKVFLLMWAWSRSHLIRRPDTFDDVPDRG